jgi:hypothetical protein
MLRRYRVLLVLAGLMVLLSLPVTTQTGQLGYYRFPALSGDTGSCSPPRVTCGASAPRGASRSA